VIADSAKADFEGTGNVVLAFALFKHGKNLRAELGRVSRERLERDRKFGRCGSLGHKDEGIVDEFRDWARP